jgi:hypothetical protein
VCVCVCARASAWQTPIKCTIRGYRKLAGDFQGNAISTGYVQSFSSPTGEINTGPISPGVTNEYDILTCRDLKVWREGAGGAGSGDGGGREESCGTLVRRLWDAVRSCCNLCNVARGVASGNLCNVARTQPLLLLVPVCHLPCRAVITLWQ